MAAHLSVVTASSPSLASARQSVIHLYRDFQRGVSHFVPTDSNNDISQRRGIIRNKHRADWEHWHTAEAMSSWTESFIARIWHMEMIYKSRKHTEHRNSNEKAYETERAKHKN